MVSVTTHRKEMFKEINECVKSMKELVDVTIGGDYNQNVASNEAKQFFVELQLKDFHQTFNRIEVSQTDHTNNRGTKCIDSIVVTPNLRKQIEGSRLFEKNEIVNTEHRSYVVDINLEEDFQEDFSEWEK